MTAENQVMDHVQREQTRALVDDANERRVVGARIRQARRVVVDRGKGGRVRSISVTVDLMSRRLLFSLSQALRRDPAHSSRSHRRIRRVALALPWDVAGRRRPCVSSHATKLDPFVLGVRAYRRC